MTSKSKSKKSTKTVARKVTAKAVKPVAKKTTKTVKPAAKAVKPVTKAAKTVKPVSKETRNATVRNTILSLISEAIRRKTNLNQLSISKGINRNRVSNYVHKLDVMVSRKSLTKKDAAEVRSAYKNYLKVVKSFR